MNLSKINLDYYKNFIFGIEDSLVSTVGVLYGVSTAISEKSTIVLTGLIVIAVEALSMGTGSFITEESTHEIDTIVHKDKPVIGGLIMFFSYGFAGFIPLLPYVFLELDLARWVSMGTTIAVLFLLGFLPSRKLRSGLRTAFVAGLVIFVGYLIGSLAR